MRVHIAADHAGYELKNHLVSWLQEHGHQALDHGAFEYDGDDDYPPFCFRAARAVVEDPGSLGIVIGGSGNGEQIAANKVKGVRAALTWSIETARLAREHNDANVMALGARMHDFEESARMVETFLGTPFSGADRHVRRIEMLSAFDGSAESPDPSTAPRTRDA
ncbi:MAG: ribose-5-phosphate isomerase [Propionibacteriales bacterium]|nr:ribose-5-phosphate isomerase [Propionibacteriales bacterium]